MILYHWLLTFLLYIKNYLQSQQHLHSSSQVHFPHSQHLQSQLHSLQSQVFLVPQPHFVFFSSVMMMYYKLKVSLPTVFEICNHFALLVLTVSFILRYEGQIVGIVLPSKTNFIALVSFGDRTNPNHRYRYSILRKNLNARLSLVDFFVWIYIKDCIYFWNTSHEMNRKETL